ncbi:hypothetical protein [Psychrobacter sp. JCM 18900]|nr:hypothetical protein [Psychrobacter sp. JCM 18900]
MTNAHNVTYESVFQTDIVTQIQAQGWQLWVMAVTIRLRRHCMSKTC